MYQKATAKSYQGKIPNQVLPKERKVFLSVATRKRRMGFMR
jgi:hypothetical protein